MCLSAVYELPDVKKVQVVYCLRHFSESEYSYI